MPSFFLYTIPAYQWRKWKTVNFWTWKRSRAQEPFSWLDIRCSKSGYRNKNGNKIGKKKTMPRVTLVKMLGNRKKKKRQGKKHTHISVAANSFSPDIHHIMYTLQSYRTCCVLCLYHRTMQKQMSKGHVTWLFGCDFRLQLHKIEQGRDQDESAAHPVPVLQRAITMRSELPVVWLLLRYGQLCCSTIGVVNHYYCDRLFFFCFFFWFLFFELPLPVTLEKEIKKRTVTGFI